MDNADQTRGKLKQALGDLTDNKDLKRQGKVDEAAGKVKKVVRDSGRKMEGLVDKVKDKVKDKASKS